MGKKQKNAEYQHNWYIKNKDLQYARTKANRVKLRGWLSELKDNPCLDCGNLYPTCAMDFDHRPGEKKLFDVSNGYLRFGMKAILAEIKKCDLVCSNCHRVRTYNRLIGV